MIYLMLKIIKPAITISVSNLNYEIKKERVAKFGNDVKDLLYDMSSNYSIIFDTTYFHTDYVRHIFRDLLPGTN